MRIEHGQNARSPLEVKAGQHDRPSVIDNTLVVIRVSFKLISISHILAHHSQDEIGQDQLIAPCHEMWLASSCDRNI